MDEFAHLDATAQADLVRRREVAPSELVEAAIGRIERLNPTLNAVVTRMYDQARDAAASGPPEGPFRGVPTLLKDLGPAYAGVPLTSGSDFTKHFVPDYDSVLVTRVKQAGMVFVGKSNTPEFGLLPTTEPRLFGPCRNPWDTSRTSGGSSGGAAAAVAAGIVPVAQASDGGGSIRIPASCCGLFGLLPTRGRVSTAPLGDITGLSRWHFVTRSVRDGAALLDVIKDPVPGDPYFAPPAPRPYREEVGVDPGRLRVAFSASSPLGGPVHPDCVAAVQDAAKLCADLGHEVEEAAPGVDGAAYRDSFMTIWYGMIAANIAMLSAALGRAPSPERFEPGTWAMIERGRRITAAQHMQALAALQGIGRRVAGFLGKYDVWLTPTLGEPPLPLGALNVTADNFDRVSERLWTYVPFTPLCNATGHPAMSVPLYWNSEGLPIGVHFAGRFGDETTLIRLAAQLEAARAWARRRPPVSADFTDPTTRTGV